MRLASTCILLVGKAKAEECSFRITQNSNTNNDLSEERNKKQAAYRQIINVVVLMSDGSACVCNSQQCIRFYLLCSQQHSTVQHSISYTLRECVFVNKLYVWSEKKSFRMKRPRNIIVYISLTRAFQFVWVLLFRLLFIFAV